jgi:putative cell wall-binding protein
VYRRSPSPPSRHLAGLIVIALTAALCAGAPATPASADIGTFDIRILGGSAAVGDAVLTELATTTSGAVTRIHGPNRFATAAQLSAATFSPGVPVVFIATGGDFPDALAGGPLAAGAGGPILLVTHDAIPSETAAELTRLQPAHITILGGAAAVSAGVEGALAAFTTGTVDRLAGADRFATAAAIAAAGFPGGAPVAYIATAANFPDALAGGPAATHDGGPILLVTPDGVPEVTATELDRLDPDNIVVLGGTAAVSDAVVTALAEHTDGAVQRLAGADRFDTAATIGETAFTEGVETVYVATGGNFPDALSGGAVAGLEDAPILLTTPDAVPAPTRRALDRFSRELPPEPPEPTEPPEPPEPEISWSPPRVISTESVSQYLTDLVAAQTADGRLHVAWRESDKILYRQLDELGNTVVDTVVTPFAPSHSVGYGERNLAIAAAPDGGAYLAWRWAGTTNPGIYAGKLDAAGRVEVPARLVRRGNLVYLTMAAGQDGTVYIVARESTVPPPSARTDRVLLGRYDAQLNPTLPWTPITLRMAYGAARHPTSLLDDAGRLHVAWFDNRNLLDRPSGHYDVFWTRLALADSGAPGTGTIDQQDLTDGEYTVPDNANDPTVAPVIDVDSSGALWAVWHTPHGRLYFAHVAPDGTVTTSDVEVAPHIAKVAMRMALRARSPQVADVLLSTGSVDLTRQTHIRIDTTGAVVAGPVPVTTTDQVRRPQLSLWDGHARFVARRGVNHHQRVVYLDTRNDAQAFATDRPDLLVDDAHSTQTSTRTPPRVGSDVTMTLRVANAGWVASPATTAVFRHGGNDIATVPVPALEPGTGTDVTATWTVPGTVATSPAGVTVTVDPDGTVTETSKANNSVDHPVEVQTVPVGATLTVVAWDETEDTGRNRLHGLDEVTYRLAGTATEGEAAVNQTVAATTGRIFATFTDVRPGSYTLTTTRDGFTGTAPVTITVSRSASDPYDLTVTPSERIDVWFNSWGTISGTVTSDGTTPLSGVKVTVQENGRTATTATNGAYTIGNLTAGAYRLTFQRSGHERHTDVPVTVPITATTTLDRTLPATTQGYVDVTVTTVGGTPLAAAQVQLQVSATSAVADQCFTGTTGRCTLTAPAGTSYMVRASKSDFVTTTSTSFTPSAGGVITRTVELPLDRAGIVTTRSSWFEQVSRREFFSVPNAGSVENLWGGWAARLAVEYTGTSAERLIHGIEVGVEGQSFFHSNQLYDVSWSVGGVPIPIGSIDWQLDSVRRSNVRVDAVRLVDLTTRDVLWESSNVLFSHSLESEQGFRSYAIPAGVTYDWSRLGVEIDVVIGKAVSWAEGSEGWEPGSPQLPTIDARQRATWQPSTGTFTFDHRL